MSSGAKTTRRAAGVALLLVVCLLALSASGANAATLDHSFAGKGFVRTPPVSVRLGFARSRVAEDARGRLLVLGAAEDALVVSRYRADGSLDRGFGKGGVAEIALTPLAGSPQPAEEDGGSGEPEPTALAIEPDGGILAGGTYDTDVGNNGAGTIAVVARLEPNGRPDPAFGTARGIGVPGVAKYPFNRVLAIAPQGSKILVAGEGGRTDIARLDGNGEVDSGFASGGAGGGDRRFDLPPGAVITALSVLPDGSIYAAGYRRGKFLLEYLKPSGQLQPSFGREGTVATAVAKQSGCGCSFATGLGRDDRGRLVLAGFVSGRTTALRGDGAPRSEPSTIALVRYLPDGSLDRSFGAAGIVRTHHLASAFGNGVAIERDGRIVLAASATQEPVASRAAPGSNFTVVRYLPNGRLDPSFGEHGYFSSRFGARSASAWEPLVDRAGRVVVVGTATYGPQRRIGALLARFG
jgi:uncharacterized delta-60 repeat protein